MFDEVKDPATEEIQDVENPEEVSSGGSTPEDEVAGGQPQEGGSEEQKDEVPQFMNPNEVPPELKEAFKRMQRSFTKAMQKLAGEREKVELAEKILENPDKAIEIIAEATGRKLNEQRDEYVDDETANYVKNIAVEAIKPLLNQLGSEVAQLKVSLVQTYLDNQYPDWYLYENEMAELLQKHPSLGNDLDKLYLLAKSAHEEVNRSRTLSQKKPTSSTKPSSGRAEEETIRPTKDLDEAMKMAMKKLGIRV